MNQYGLPLSSNSVQSILPVMYDTGEMIGFFSITQTTFTGAETSFVLPDLTVPIKSVTIDVDPRRPERVRQYMAAVYPAKTQPRNVASWASAYLRTPDEGFTRLFRMPTESWAILYQPSILQAALEQTMSHAAGAPVQPGPPTVTTPATLYWKTSISYQALLGDCLFFDFDWVTLFAASSPSQALRIVSTGVPAATPPFGPPFAAQVLGIPTTVGAGVVRYDTIRIMRLLDTPPAAGNYTFNFNVYSDAGGSTTALANPGAATGVGSATGGSLAAATYYTKIVALDVNGYPTAPSAESTGVVTTGSTSSIAYTWAAVPNAASYQIWFSTATGTEANYFTSTTNSFTLTTTSGATAGTIPSANQTGTLTTPVVLTLTVQ